MTDERLQLIERRPPSRPAVFERLGRRLGHVGSDPRLATHVSALPSDIETPRVLDDRPARQFQMGPSRRSKRIMGRQCVIGF